MLSECGAGAKLSVEVSIASARIGVDAPLEVSVVIPCLTEADTLAACMHRWIVSILGMRRL